MRRRLARTELESLRQVLQATQDRRCQEAAANLAAGGGFAQVIVGKLWWQAQTLYEKEP